MPRRTAEWDFLLHLQTLVWPKSLTRISAGHIQKEKHLQQWCYLLLWVMRRINKIKYQTRSKTTVSSGADLWTNTDASHSHGAAPLKPWQQFYETSHLVPPRRRAWDMQCLSTFAAAKICRRRQTAGDKQTVVWTDLRLNALWCSAGGIYAPTAAGSGCQIYLAPRDITARWDFKVKYLFEDA